MPQVAVAVPQEGEKCRYRFGRADLAERDGGSPAYLKQGIVMQERSNTVCCTGIADGSQCFKGSEPDRDGRGTQCLDQQGDCFPATPAQCFGSLPLYLRIRIPEVTDKDSSIFF